MGRADSAPRSDIRADRFVEDDDGALAGPGRDCARAAVEVERPYGMADAHSVPDVERGGREHRLGLVVRVETGVARVARAIRIVLLDAKKASESPPPPGSAVSPTPWPPPSASATAR